MSEIKVNKISPRTACGTTTLGDSGDTFTIPSGVTITNNGTANGFGATGAVNWQTGDIKTATFTPTSGEGYFINSGSALTANLPAGSAGAIVAFADYARNFATYNFTVSPNGSEKIGGIAADVTLDIDGQAATFVYVDSTKGWVNIQNAEDTETGQSFITATGGTITTSGNCKIHTFTSPGTFCVSAASAQTANNQVSYLVVAGGGGGGYDVGGGGGAGGFRERKSPATPYTASPLEGAATITVTATGFPITVGGGGAGSTANYPTNAAAGSNSVFSTITSAGGGYGGSYPAGDGGNGGSGGGGSGHNQATTGGTGNSPPVNPSQGNPGGNAPAPLASSSTTGAGGGGATATGSTSLYPAPNTFTPRAAGGTTSITASPVEYAQGGRGAADGAPNQQAGGANTGTGGDAAGNQGGPTANHGAAGGSGIVVIRYRFQ
jgi:hypothetical protein